MGVFVVYGLGDRSYIEALSIILFLLSSTQISLRRVVLLQISCVQVI